MAQDFFPKRDVNALNFSRNLAKMISADPERYGLTEAIAAEFDAAFVVFDDTMKITQRPAIRSQSAVMAKNQARKVLESAARNVNRRVKAANLEAPLLINLGLNVRGPGRGRAIAKPTFAPSLSLVGVNVRTVTVNLREQAGAGRVRKPAGVSEAMIFAYIGRMPSARESDWMFMCKTSTATAEVNFKDDTLPAGTRVWLVAYWSNRQGHGPISRPIHADLQSGVSNVHTLAA